MTRLTEHLDSFLAFARQRTGDDELAADVVQTALGKALERRQQLRRDDRLLAWFWRILRNTLAELQRQEARRGRALRELPAAVEQLPQASVDRLCACLEAVVATLPAGPRELLRQLELGGREPGAVARELGITANNLGVRRHRARRALHDALLASCRQCAVHGCFDCDCAAARDG